MFYNFNVNNFYNKDNSRKFIVLGVILLAIGVYCLSRNNIGIKIFSWGIGILFLYITWLFFKDLNELKRYADKKTIRRYTIYEISSLLVAILLFIFPKEFNIALSVFIGVVVLYRAVSSYFSIGSYNYHRVDMWFLIRILIGIMLIISPLFLSRFLISIMSVIAIICGVYYINIGIQLGNGRKYF